jgi:two-component system response regulator HydG
MMIPGDTVATGKAGTAASLEEVERETILRTLAGAGGNKSEAARCLGITRRTLHQKLRKYGMM